MPKMTAKYSNALEAARQAGIKARPGIDQEELYSLLSESNHMWDSDQKQWIALMEEPAEKPTELVMVRVWADMEIVEEAADDIEATYQKRGYALLERSEPYRCRPPKQLEARVYLKFTPPGKAKK
jgi:hypothetical protein